MEEEMKWLSLLCCLPNTLWQLMEVFPSAIKIRLTSVWGSSEAQIALHPEVKVPGFITRLAVYRGGAKNVESRKTRNFELACKK